MGIKPKTKLHWARKFNALRKYYQLPSIATQGVDLHPVASTRPDPAPLKAFKKPCWFRAPVININVGVAKGDFSWFRAALNVRFFESVRLGQYCPVKMKLRPVWYIVYLYLSHHLPIKLDFHLGGDPLFSLKPMGFFGHGLADTLPPSGWNSRSVSSPVGCNPKKNCVLKEQMMIFYLCGLDIYLGIKNKPKEYPQQQESSGRRSQNSNSI